MSANLELIWLMAESLSLRRLSLVPALSSAAMTSWWKMQSSVGAEVEYMHHVVALYNDEYLTA